MVDPDGALGAWNRDFDRRRLYLSQTWDGLFILDGVLDPEGGSLLRTALEAIMGPPSADDQRTTTQRRADALVQLAHRQLDRGELPETSGQKPHLTLTADLATLRQEPGSRAAELDWGQPIPAETLRRLSCDCALTVVGVGTGGEPLSMGRTRRTIPPSLRRALKVRDRHCRFPGCDRPVEWTDPHHYVHWVDGGETSLKNCLLVCRAHHTAAQQVEEGLGTALSRPPRPFSGRVAEGWVRGLAQSDISST